jgi:hypothetical protein
VPARRAPPPRILATMISALINGMDNIIVRIMVPPPKMEVNARFSSRNQVTHRFKIFNHQKTRRHDSNHQSSKSTEPKNGQDSRRTETASALLWVRLSSLTFRTVRLESLTYLETSNSGLAWGFEVKPLRCALKGRDKNARTHWRTRYEQTTKKR